MKKQILIVGQTPPPYGGQAIIIQNIINYNYDKVLIRHVRLHFSKTLDENRKFSFHKLFELLKVILSIYWNRLFYSVKTLYYPPAGPDKLPIIRDCIILILTKWLFTDVIFHFHAGGLSEYYKKSNIFMKWFMNKAYESSKYSIILSEYNPNDGKVFNTKKQIIIPYGIRDSLLDNHRYLNKIKNRSGNSILYVGLLCESKGLLILLDACKILKSLDLSFKINIVGEFESNSFKDLFFKYIYNYDLDNYVNIHGIKTGEEKFDIYAASDIFCFPTYFESETFGIVLLEAMQFKLPIVSSKWRGTQSLVNNGENGFLVTPKDPEQLSDKLYYLLTNVDHSNTMGNNGRQMYLQSYSSATFKKNIEKVFVGSIK